jgi:hypothetical protein
MTAPMPAPAAPAPAPAPAPAAAPVDPNAAPPAPAPTDQGGQSATDAAGDDLGAWQAAAEMDSRFTVLRRPDVASGQMG